MKTSISRLIIYIVICSGALFLAFSFAFAQKDTVEFKFIPPSYPEANARTIPLEPPHVIYSPKILYPDDPKLQGQEGKVWVKVMVDRTGEVRDAQVLKSTDRAFNKHALKYAKQFKFKWTGKWPDELKNKQTVPVSVAINFKH